MDDLTINDDEIGSEYSGEEDQNNEEGEEVEGSDIENAEEDQNNEEGEEVEGSDIENAEEDEPEVEEADESNGLRGYNGQRVYRLGERGSGYEERNIQDFLSLRTKCLQEEVLFEDPDFPADDSSIQFSGSIDKEIEWRRPSEIVDKPQLFVEGFSRFDVKQGELGDCWLISSIASLTFEKKLFKQVVPDDQNFQDDYAGIFHFRFWKFGKWVDVVIDDRLPTNDGNLIYLRSGEENEFWGALLEKAYAKLHGSYESLIGGNGDEALEDFTGGVTERFKLNNIPKNFFTILLQAYKHNALIGCGINSDSEIVEEKTLNGLVKGHAYSVTRVCSLNSPKHEDKIQLIRIRNPWGNSVEWNGAWSDKSEEWSYISESDKENMGLTINSDGEFWMSLDDFTIHFSDLDICHWTFGLIDSEDIQSGSNKLWSVKMFDGEWVKGKTAGGCGNHRDTFWQNPQFIITLTDPDEDDEEDLCTVIISLMQKKRRAQRSEGISELSIGFDVYSQSPDDPKPLPASYFNDNKSIDTNLTFNNTREVNCRLKLEPGTYCIIPSTYDPDEEGEFLLRIFTENSSN